MKKVQRFKYEMLVRVRDFGSQHAAIFPENSVGGGAMARVLAAAAKFEEQMKDHVLGRGEARRVKASTRDAVYNQLKTIAAAARRFTRADAGVNPFVIPPQRSLPVVLSTARAFMESATSRQTEFEKFGLPATFINDFKVAVDQLQQAADVRLAAKTARSKAQTGINVALADGLDAVRDLDVVVAIATRQSDPATYAAWNTARRIEGLSSGTGKAAVTPIAPAPAAEAPPAPVVPPIAASPTTPLTTELEKAS